MAGSRPSPAKSLAERRAKRASQNAVLSSRPSAASAGTQVAARGFVERWVPARPCGPSGMTGMAFGAVIVLAATLSPALAQEGLRPYVVIGNAIPESLTGAPGDPARGRAIVANRQTGLCLLCHSGPFPEERFQGNLAPDLTAVGARLSEGQIRQRIVDPTKVNPQSIMPAYYKSEGLVRVA